MLENNNVQKFLGSLENNIVIVTLTFVKLYEMGGESKQSKTGYQERLTFIQQEQYILNNYLGIK